MSQVSQPEARWAVPAGAIVDGASIPKIFWPIVGAPLDDNYRDASIIHDWYCDRRTRTWQATHRVFYDAMIVSGVGTKKAKIMYFAVYWRGPRWEERVTRNNLFGFLGNLGRFNFVTEPRSTRAPRTIASPGEAFDEDEQTKLFVAKIDDIERNNYDLNEIEDLAENLKVA